VYGLINQENYSRDFDGAMKAAKNGDVWGIISIGENFTHNWEQRLHFMTDNATLEGSTVFVHLDMTSECSNFCRALP
jgi:hypothetical protein